MQRGKINKKIIILGTKRKLTERKLGIRTLSTPSDDNSKVIPVGIRTLSTPFEVIPAGTENTSALDVEENYFFSITNATIEPIFCIPLASNTICLTNSLDNQQAFCVFGPERQKCLVVISKKKFRIGESEQEGVITGCSVCGGVMNNFMIFYGDCNCNIEEKPDILRCVHIKMAIASMLSNNGVWKSTFSKQELESIVLENLREENESKIFYNENHIDYCGAIIDNYGLFLFIQKSEKWRCVSCGEREIAKCKHGQLINLPFTEEFYESSERIPPIGHSKSHIMGTSIIEGNN